MNIAKCPWCSGKGHRMKRNDYLSSDNHGEFEKYPCIAPCYDGKIRYEKLSSSCDICDGKGQIKYWRDTGSFIPGFKKKIWHMQCKKCLGSGKEIQICFKCKDCNDGVTISISRKRGLFGWREAKKKSKCNKCNGTGYIPGSYDVSKA